MKKTKETPNVRTVSSLLALLAVHYRDGNCNVECRVLYLGGPECAKITLQKSGSRGHSPTTPSITWCLPLVDILEHAKTSSTNVQFNVTIVIIIFVIYVIHTRILLASSYAYIYTYIYVCIHIIKIESNCTISVCRCCRSLATSAFNTYIKMHFCMLVSTDYASFRSYSDRSDSMHERGMVDCQFAW